MSYGARGLAAFSAVFLIFGLGAQDNKEPTPKDRFLHPRQLPYHAPDDVPTSGQAGGKKDDKSGRKGKATSQLDFGLKYSIVKLVDGKSVEVRPDSEFHKDDRIRIRVESNYPGYLYMLNKGTSGQWGATFPAPEDKPGSNKIFARRAYTMPPGEAKISFDEHPGVEHLTILFARQLEPDFEKVIRSREKLEMAARDLIIERPPVPTGAGEPKDNAVYAVNSTGKPDAFIFLDIPLTHK